MPRIDLPEKYASNLLSQSVRDSLMSHGEEVILLHLFHASEDSGTQERCPVCYDDLYNQAEEQMCDICWGTTFRGGVKTVCRAWALFSGQANVEETIGKRGVYDPEHRTVQIEYPPTLMQRDCVVRISEWGPNKTPQKVRDFYHIGKVDTTTVNTGNKFGQFSGVIVGQRAPVYRIPDSHVITKYPIVGRRFSRLDGGPR